VERNADQDHFSYGYSLCWIAFFTPFIILAFFPGYNGASMLAFFLSLIIGAILTLCFVGILIAQLWKRRWRKVISVFVSPFIGALVLLLVCKSHFPLWVYLQVHKPTYLEQIALEPHTKDTPIKKSFHVGYYGMVASAGGEYSIDYDDSDAVASLPETNHCVSVTHLEGHFYYVTAEENECADLHS
jgi:hypothetical protein